MLTRCYERSPVCSGNQHLTTSPWRTGWRVFSPRSPWSRQVQQGSDPRAISPGPRKPWPRVHPHIRTGCARALEGDGPFHGAEQRGPPEYRPSRYPEEKWCWSRHHRPQRPLAVRLARLMHSVGSRDSRCWAAVKARKRKELISEAGKNFMFGCA